MSKRNFVKKIIITVVMTMLALGVLTACTKTDESVDNENVSTEGEDLLETEGTRDGDAEDTDVQDTGAKDSAGEASSEEMELMGMIEEVPEDSDDSFIIAKLVTEQVNGMDLIGTDEEDTRVTVVYSDDTKFIKRTVQSGGEDAEEREGMAADLKENCTVEMKGSYYEENVFFAAEVEIVEVK